MSNIDETLAERGSRYGEFAEHARITQNIKAAMADSPNWGTLDNDIKECLEMIAHKIGRVLNGDPRYVDNFTDICGYARLVEKRLIDDAQTVMEVPPPNDVAVKEAMEVLLKAGVIHFT